MPKLEKRTLLPILRDALKLEHNGAWFFRDSLQRVENPAAAAVISRLIDEEQEHIRVILRAIAALSSGDEKEAFLVSPVARPGGYFNREEQRRFLSQVRENPALPDVAVFESAWRMEKEIADFYGKAAELVPGPLRDLLMVLHDFEKRHEIFFKRHHDALADRYAIVYRERPWA